MKIGAGAGLLFISPLGVHLRYVIRIHFVASNNIAEYEALVNGLRIAIELGVRRFRFFCILILSWKKILVWTLENFNVIFGPFARRRRLWRRVNTARRHRLWRRGTYCAGTNGRRGADVAPSSAP
jgi:ribonuclease HI